MQVTVIIKTNTQSPVPSLPLASIFSGTLIKWERKKNEKEREEDGRQERKKGGKERREKEPEQIRGMILELLKLSQVS